MRWLCWLGLHRDEQLARLTLVTPREVRRQITIVDYRARVVTVKDQGDAEFVWRWFEAAVTCCRSCRRIDHEVGWAPLLTATGSSFTLAENPPAMLGQVIRVERWPPVDDRTDRDPNPSGSRSDWRNRN